MPGLYKALVLSRGEQFDPPPLVATRHGFSAWPQESSAYTTFYASDGGVIATVWGEVTPQEIRFDASPGEVDGVPAGAQYETFLIDGEGRPKQLRYGQVIRRQAQFFSTPARSTGNQALQFRDDFHNRKGLVGSKWFVTLGRPTIFDNSDDNDPNGVGPHTVFGADAAMRYFAPLNTNSWLLSFNLLNPGAGKTGIVVGSNAAMTMYRYVMFESGIANNKLHMGRGTGPINLTDQVPTVAHTVVDNTNYKLRYDDATKRFGLWDSGLTTELIGWTDENEIMPSGPGYRYFGANWQSSLFSSGVQLTSISAQDGPNA